MKLSDFLEEVSEKTTQNNQYSVLTSSKNGIFPQDNYFNKQVASKDNTGYKVIRRGEFTYRAMSDTGEFYPNMLECTDIGIVSPAYPVFRISKDVIIPEYLKYYFKSKGFQKSITSFVQGSTRASMKFGKMKTISIDPPDKETQLELTKKLNLIRVQIKIKTKELSLLDTLIKARFVEMFGDVVANNMGWNTKPMSEVAPANSPKVQIHGNVWLLNLDMIEPQSGNILCKHYVPSSELNTSICAFDSKNVLYSKLRPYLNKVVLPDQEGYCTTELVPLKPTARLNREYLAALLRSGAFVGYINSKTAGAKMPRVSMNIFRRFECVLPPIELQNQFASFVSQVDKSKFAIQKLLVASKNILQLIKEDLNG